MHSCGIFYCVFQANSYFNLSFERGKQEIENEIENRKEKKIKEVPRGSLFLSVLFLGPDPHTYIQPTPVSPYCPSPLPFTVPWASSSLRSHSFGPRPLPRPCSHTTPTRPRPQRSATQVISRHLCHCCTGPAGQSLGSTPRAPMFSVAAASSHRHVGSGLQKLRLTGPSRIHRSKHRNRALEMSDFC